MTETAVVSVVAALIGAFPPTIVAWLALRQSRANAKKADEITGKVNEVHVLTNSNLSELKSQLLVANTEIGGLKNLVASLLQPKRATRRKINVK